MGLFDKITTSPAPQASGAARGGYEYVEIPTPDGKVTRLTKSQFEAQPLAQRIGVLVEGTARFFRGGQVVPSNQALKSDY